MKMDHTAWMVFGKHDGLYHDPEPIMLFTSIDLAKRFIEREKAHKLVNPHYGYDFYSLEEWGIFSSVED